MQISKRCWRATPDRRYSSSPESIPDDLPAKLAAAGMGVDLYYKELTAERVRAFRRAGVAVNCWTCDDPEDAARLISWGVDMITTNILQ